MPHVNVDGLSIHYDQRGEGPDIVLLHGIGGNTKLWRYQLEGLSGGFRVTAWDAPGYGGSEDPDANDWTMAGYAERLAGFLDALGIERAHILGQSWGGVLAQEFYRSYPERFISLVLSDTYAGGGAQPAGEQDSALQARLRALDTMTPAEMARQRVHALLMPDAPQELVAEVESVLAEIHPAGYRMAAIALANANTLDVQPAIAVPTLITAGDSDAIVPPERAREMQATIPESQLVVIENAGHLPCVERPEIYNDAIREFLDEVEGLKTREDLLNVVSGLRADLDAAIAEAGEERTIQPGSFEELSFKDLIAHLTGWRLVMAARLEAGLRHEEPVFPWPDDFDEAEDLHEINRWFFETNREKPLHQVIAESNATFLRVERAIAAMPEEDLLESGRFDWLFWTGEALGPAVVRGTLNHYRIEHEPDILAWLQREPAPGEAD